MRTHAQQLLEVDEGSWHDNMSPAEVMEIIASEQQSFGVQAAASHVNQQRAAASWAGATIGAHFAVENSYDVTHFMAMGLQETFECWTNEEFIREASRDIPESRIRSQRRNASIIMPASRYTRIDRRALAMDGALIVPVPYEPTHIVGITPIHTQIVAVEPAATRIVARKPEATRIVAKQPL